MNFWSDSRRTPEDILGKLLDGFSDQFWRLLRIFSRGILKELLDEFSGNFCTNSRGPPGEIPRKLLETGELLEELWRNFWKNFRENR